MVADEVRTLAAEAGRSAREVAELLADLQAGIDATARAMQSGEAKVRDIGAVAGEADGALQELHQGVQLMGDLVNATADVSRSQAQRLVELAQALTDVSDISAVLDISYDTVSGSFDMPQGAGWLVNSSSVAKYVNKAAPTGGATKVSAIKPGSLVKVVRAG